jgi:hypothetical protein
MNEDKKIHLFMSSREGYTQLVEPPHKKAKIDPSKEEL